MKLNSAPLRNNSSSIFSANTHLPSKNSVIRDIIGHGYLVCDKFPQIIKYMEKNELCDDDKKAIVEFVNNDLNRTAYGLPYHDDLVNGCIGIVNLNIS